LSSDRDDVVVDRDDGNGGDVLAGIDSQDISKYRSLLSDGSFTREELGKCYALSEAQVAALATPARPSAASVAAELAELAQLRRSNPREYWLEQNQRRERELLQRQDEAKADAPARRADGQAEGSLKRIDEELAAIAERRRTDRIGYMKDDQLQAHERELLEQKAQATETARAQEQITGILDNVENRSQFEADFDALPAESLQAVRVELGRPVEASPVRIPTAADLERFKSTPEGRECAELWGKDAPRKLGILRERIARMESEAAWNWFDSLSSQDARAVILALSGG
jgi:hypothetical protein